MVPDKQIKKEFKLVASKNPDKYYPTITLKALNFVRNQCKKCKTYFWAIDKDRKICGDSSCVGEFKFIGNTPAKKKLGYLDVWKEFVKIHEKLGYTPIDRYPVVARWRDDTEFVQAGIYDFQPYVVSGEVEPPANPVIEPQFCLRFNDIDNVGITGSHYTGFIMLGEHAFMNPDDFDPNKYLKDHLTWLNEGLGLDFKDIIIHEDAWAGGGNFGPCVEFFSRGLELSNQVYIQFEQTEDGYKELQLKVLDMGQGYERVPWFTLGESTSYETTFPTVIEKLRKITKVEYDAKLMNKFLPYASLLNVDEVDDIEEVWKIVANKVGVRVDELKEKVLPQQALYSIADHSRSLLLALNDGALPSNTGGGYNLRIIFRRAQSFIDKFNWNIDLADVCEWHAEFLKPLFPELIDNLEDVRKLINVEKSKFEASRQKALEIVKKSVRLDLSEKDLLELYDSHGVAPELIREEAMKSNKIVKVPADFYTKVTLRHEKKNVAEKVIKKNLIDPELLEKIKETKIEYYEDWSKIKFSAKVLFSKGKYVILDKTLFYATSGGQDNDLGKLNENKIVDVVRQGSYIIHVLEKNNLKVDDIVEGKIDLKRRKQLAQHHTVAHIINAAAKRVLGNHINQAGAKKTIEKGHLDITHYSSLTPEETKKIEEEANKIVVQEIPVRSKFLPRTEAEQIYGMRIYQGGAVPGKLLRIVEIPEVDVEACGGTHLKNTLEADEIKIINSKKISDSVVRIMYVAGDAAKNVSLKETKLLVETAEILGVSINEVPNMAEILFKLWKRKRKAKKKGKEFIDVLPKKVEPIMATPEELLDITAKIFSTQVEYVPKTAKRFLKDLEGVSR